MIYVYVAGAERWRRHDGHVRRYRPARGWTAEAEIADVHPVTGRPLPDSQWWIREVFTGEQSAPQQHH